MPGTLLDEEERRRVDALWRMLAALDPPAQAEIERALRLTLFAEPPAYELRWAELGPLARMLDTQAERQGLRPPGRSPRRHPRAARQRLPVIPPVAYDAARPPDAPDSDEVSARFGDSWERACRAVWGLMDDGRYAGWGVPWDNAVRGRPRIRYTDDERVAAIRACAWHFGRRPTTTLYIRWGARRRAEARKGGKPLPRIPSYESLRRRYGGWHQALAAAVISEQELAAARAEKASRSVIFNRSPARLVATPSRDSMPQETLAAISDQTLAAAGLDPRQICGEHSITNLPLAAASTLAGVLGGSLDWLTGRDPQKGPAAAPVSHLDSEAVRWRLDSGVSDLALQQAVGCTTSA